MSLLAQQAQDLLEAATAAAAQGERCTEMTILIGPDGSIRMCAESDWPLESLAREHGARAAYRVTGNAADAEQALEVVKTSEAATECHVAEVLGDCAYGAGETRAEFAAAGRTLIAKVPDLQNQGHFVKTDFQIDLEARTCTCPSQQTTRDFRVAKGGGGVFVFDAKTCATCPLRTLPENNAELTYCLN